MRLVTDIQGMERVVPPEVAVAAYSADLIPSRAKRNFLLLLAALRSDHLAIHFRLPEVIFFTLFLFIIPFHRCRLTTLDFFIGQPRGWMLPLIRWSLGRVSRFLVYFRDSSIFEQMLDLPRSKFYYVPFKVNAFELIQATPARDEGYIFSGGRSRRDFATFFAAVQPLGYPVKLVTSGEEDLTPHGSSMRGLSVPDNVEILRKDSSAEFFVNCMAGARLVVIPIVRDSTTQAGIGVYLQALALHKCLVISSGLGVSDVLTEGQAMIVPPGDVQALRDAIEKAWRGDALRERYAEAGYRYATPLGAEDELRRSVWKALPRDVQRNSS